MSTGDVKIFCGKENVCPAAAFASLPPVDSTSATVAAPITGRTPMWLGLKPRETAAMLGVSLLVLLASYGGWWPIGLAEAWGFVTGGVCVWLVVREHVWNWPVGLANNVFFFVIFLRGRLYADMSLQVVYLGLGIYGWLNWLFGGKGHTALAISRTSRGEWAGLVAAVPLCTWGMFEVLVRVNDAAPLWDALTTALSLAAQYLLCRKRFENWWFWIAADVIYIPLYFSRKLPLTAVLYGVFLAMCLVGVRQWSRSLKGGGPLQ
jgi:nicotinamide mononucleotide transporter